MATVAQLVERLKNEPGYEWKTRSQREALVELEEKTTSKLPTRKITSASLAGAVSTLAVFVAGHYGMEIDPEAASSLTLILSILAGYIVKD